MNIYTTDKIRNVVLLGHGGCGKTSLAEAMAYLSGITSRMGKVEDGNTVSDFGKEEQKRKISISASVIPVEWEGYKVNILEPLNSFTGSAALNEMRMTYEETGYDLVITTGNTIKIYVVYDSYQYGTYINKFVTICLLPLKIVIQMIIP